ncbi:MAG: class I SAM-dependent methyltransferase [Mariprofundaceae bacterium]|nr:class I SAM-dependent methyltransferase [Mariprofundaceae bacterium]
MRLTERVHHDLKKYVQLGDGVVDATSGNGHDTLFLAQLVGIEGQVFTFDVQLEALEKTRQRIEQYESIAPIQYIHRGHECMQAEISKRYHGRIRAIVFNLGYLPQANHAVMTMPDTTICALQQSTSLLCQGGVISILAYTGHIGGRDEAESIKKWLLTLDNSFEYDIEIPKNTRASPPEYILIRKIDL